MRYLLEIIIQCLIMKKEKIVILGTTLELCQAIFKGERGALGAAFFRQKYRID